MLPFRQSKTDPNGDFAPRLRGYVCQCYAKSLCMGLRNHSGGHPRHILEFVRPSVTATDVVVAKAKPYGYM